MLELSLKQETAMKTSTLYEVVFFTQLFLEVAEKDFERLCDYVIIDDGKGVAALSARLDNFVLWLHEREKQFIKQAQSESTAQEVALVHPLDKSLDEGLTEEQIFGEKTKCIIHLRRQLEYDWEDIQVAFDELHKRAKVLSDKTLEKYKQKR